ncbi:MAG: hypothetical protein RLZZ198_2036 [Bacteroidota bacterium]|jgi:uncharacterized protein YbaP (TraB family)
MKTAVLLVSLLASFLSNSQLLYEIKSKDGQHTSYIFGTIHLMPREQFNIDSTLTAAFNKSRMIAMEVDLNMDLAQKIELAKETILPEGKTLRDICTDAQYRLIYSYALDSMHMSKKKFKRYSRLKPFFFSSVMLQESLEDTKSYELEFGEMAKKGSKKTMGLESIQVQMQTINTVSLEDQVRMLIDGMNQTQGYDAMLSNYLSESIDALYIDIITESEGFPNFVENFLNKRNTQWIPVITDQIERENTFIAVGAGHLPGPKGVLELLRAQGYSLTPIRRN